MCHSSKTLSQSQGERPRTHNEPGTSTLRIQRQESVVMENLRQLEEREALDKWERIVRYCKEVSLKNNYNFFASKLFYATKLSLPTDK